jgi:hypothetical protein
VIAFAVAVGACFYINQWLGLGVFLGALAAQPADRLGIRDPVAKDVRGQAIDPPAVQHAPASVPVTVGQTGVAVSRLGPVGECDFGEHRFEAVAERGFIEPRQQVKVVAITAGKPVVRAV